MAYAQYLPVIIHGGMSGLRPGVNVHDSFFLRLTLTLHPKSLRGISSKQSVDAETITVNLPKATRSSMINETDRIA